MHTEFELEIVKVRWEDNVKKNVKEIKCVKIWAQFIWEHSNGFFRFFKKTICVTIYFLRLAFYRRVNGFVTAFLRSVLST